MGISLLDFKIYVPTQNEENLIAHTVNALTEVFDPNLIEVLDLGSQDSTVSRVPSGIRVTEIVLPDKNAGRYYTALKNKYSQKQKRVLWVDGDEIYPIRSSLGIVSWLNSGSSRPKRLYWRILKEEDGRKYQSNEFLSAGSKAFNSEHQQFRRAWPYEVTVPELGFECGPKENFTGLWFWHGVLLKRSSSKELTARRKKRMGKEARYNQMMTWEEIAEWPWDFGYASEKIMDWTVVSANLRKSKKGDIHVKKWEGSFGMKDKEDLLFSFR